MDVPTYNAFEFYVTEEQRYRLLREHGVVPRGISYRSYLRAMFDRWNDVPPERQQQAMSVIMPLMADMIHESLSRPIWFVTPGLVEALDAVDFDVRLSEAISPRLVASVAFPRGCEVPPVLFVDERSAPGTMDQLGQDAFKRLGYPTGSALEQFETGGVRSVEVYGWDGPRTNRPGARAMWAVDEDYRLDDPRLGIVASDDLHRRAMVTCLKLSAYIRTFPHCLRPGWPTAERKGYRREGAWTIEADAKLMRAAELHGTHASPSAHFRRGHFRVLRDERYKRADDGGARIVWVSPTFVGGEVDPYTAAKDGEE